MLNRREFLAISALSAPPLTAASAEIPMRAGVPSVDYHVHIGDGISIDQAVEASRRRGVKFGLLQHAGAAADYAVNDDRTLEAWVRSLEGKPVFKGIEAESVNWASLFSKAAISKLDYVQADALGMPDSSGKSMQIWKPDFRPPTPQAFMDRYVDFHVQRISTEPIDIFVVPTFLPESLLPDYDRLWTTKRARTVIEAAVKANVALEIDCRFGVPRLRFLEMARSAGIKFAFGSNYQTLSRIGDISYCVQMYKRLGLTPNHFFRPSGAGSRF